jgi:hypothetical protein
MEMIVFMCMSKGSNKTRWLENALAESPGHFDNKDKTIMQVAHEEMTESAFGAATPSNEVSRWKIGRSSVLAPDTAAAPLLPHPATRRAAAPTPPDSPRPRGVTLARFRAASPTPLRVTARFVQIWALLPFSEDRGVSYLKRRLLKIMPASIARRIGAGA